MASFESPKKNSNSSGRQVSFLTLSFPTTSFCGSVRDCFCATQALCCSSQMPCYVLEGSYVVSCWNSVCSPTRLVTTLLELSVITTFLLWHECHTDFSPLILHLNCQHSRLLLLRRPEDGGVFSPASEHWWSPVFMVREESQSAVVQVQGAKM